MGRVIATEDVAEEADEGGVLFAFGRLGSVVWLAPGVADLPAVSVVGGWVSPL